MDDGLGNLGQSEEVVEINLSSNGKSVDEIVDINLSQSGKVLPQKNNKIALIDADTLVFAACTTLEVADDLLPQDFYSEEEWEEIIKEPGYSELDHCIYYTNQDEAMKHVKDRINGILEATGCSDYELHFTSKRENFRYKLLDNMYKATRSSRAPEGLWELREAFVNDGKAHIWVEWEADDIVVALKRDNPNKYVLCAVDKDVLYSLPGKHFNYYVSRKYSIDMKWIEVTKETAMKHHYIQTLTGDPSDNVPGLRGIGPKKAEKILEGCEDVNCLWERVVKAYEDNGKTIIDAITTMRLVHMHQLIMNKDGKYELNLWRPQV